jgi:predicted nuclease of predicted toxin-antitoxin system
MRFIIDAQLPPALARYLSSLGHDAVHVGDLGMATAEDGAIWRHALETSAVIVTKDEDFASRFMMTQQGPAIVWIRIGNTSKQALLEWFKPMVPTIEQALSTGERLIEVI